MKTRRDNKTYLVNWIDVNGNSRSKTVFAQSEQEAENYVRSHYNTQGSGVHVYFFGYGV